MLKEIFRKGFKDNLDTQQNSGMVRVIVFNATINKSSISGPGGSMS
jgi:hypothetical protein